MSRWRRSVDELASRRRQQGECDRAQEALSRVTSCFQQLAASLGSSADGSFLRDEMDETRALAHRICRGTPCTCLSVTCLSVPVCLSPVLLSPVCLTLTCLKVCPSVWCVCCQTVTPPPQVWRTDRCLSVCGFSSCQLWKTSCLTSVRPVIWLDSSLWCSATTDAHWSTRVSWWLQFPVFQAPWLAEPYGTFTSYWLPCFIPLSSPPFLISH